MAAEAGLCQHPIALKSSQPPLSGEVQTSKSYDSHLIRLLCNNLGALPLHNPREMTPIFHATGIRYMLT
jgi:hypothetical protein